MPNGFSRVDELETCEPMLVVEGGVDPPAGVGLLALNDDHGRQTMRPMANSPAAMPIATRADLKTV